MHYHHEKLIFGSASFIGSLLCSMGAIMTSGELRWIYVTLAVGVITSAFLALMCRKDEETIKTTIGRCGISIMLSMFGSKAVVHYYKAQEAVEDVLVLSGIAMAVCIFGYFVAHAFLKALDKNSGSFASELLNIVKLILKTWLTKKP
jgi:uncharacterized membrane protein